MQNKERHQQFHTCCSSECYILVFIPTGGYEDWKSWKPRCDHVFTAETSVILSEYLPGNRPPTAENYIYLCNFKILRPEGDSIVLMWKKFQLGLTESWDLPHYVKVSGI